MAKHYPNVDTDDYYVWVDRYAFFGFAGLYLIMHVVMLTWLISVPLAYRREMLQKDEEYILKYHRKSKLSRASTTSRHIVLNNEKHNVTLNYKQTSKY